MVNAKRSNKAGTRGLSPSSPRSARSVQDYLDKVPEPARRNFAALQTAVRSAVPDDAIEVISYGIPAFKRGKVLVWFAAFSNHCSLFPTAAVLAEFRDELMGFVVSKGTVQFPLEKPVPVTLVKKLVKARVVQAQGGES